MLETFLIDSIHIALNDFLRDTVTIMVLLKQKNLKLINQSFQQN